MEFVNNNLFLLNIADWIRCEWGMSGGRLLVGRYKQYKSVFT